MATTYTAIATTTVGAGGAANIEFTSIPQTYTDLCVLFSTRSSTGSPDSKIYFNGTTANSYGLYFFNVGGSVTNGTTTDIVLVGNPKSTYTADVFGNGQIYIFDYTSTKYKTVLTETIAENNSGADFFQLLASGSRDATAAITSVTLAASVGYVEHSTATLYGIKNS